jgi:hypothetical protein
MPRYVWEGRTAAGAVVRGEVEALSPDAVRQNLQSSRITVVRIAQRAGGTEDYTTPPSGPPSARPRRPGESLRDKLFYFGIAAAGVAISVGVGFLDPIHIYDCARQPTGSVDCTVHRRAFGMAPLGDLAVSRIESAQTVSGEYAETMSETRRRLESGRRKESWDALLLVSADGTRWRSPQTSWPLGRSPSDLRAGIQELLDARAPGSYHAWAGNKVTLIVSLAFLAPAGLILLGGLLRLVIPRSSVERLLAAHESRRRRTPRP